MSGPVLPQSQVEILRLLLRRPGLRAREIAEELGLASNTVSTLLHQLAARGYLEREVDNHDRRSARITIAPAAVDRLNTWSDMRSALLTAALTTLDAADYERMVACLPALERLAGLLESTSDVD